MTRRLYHDDAYLRRFDAEVVAITQHKARPAIVLDRTAFYPEAGGQLGDHGRLGDATVVDTQEADDGAILHVIDGAPPAVGAQVTGEIDWLRRRQHMAQHTAQHLLSGALLDRAQAATVSARLGDSALTIDVARDRIPEAELAGAEDLANDLIDDDLAIRAWFPPPDELAQIKLRRDPKVTGNVRIVAIGDFDLSPCGGTHCARTSQLGAVRITGAERYKGMTRVTFTAARRGRAELFARDQVLRGLAGVFSCGPAEVPAAVDKLRRDAEARDAELTQLRGRLAAAIIAQLPPAGPVAAALPVDAELLRSIAARLAGAGRDALLCAPDDAGTTVVLMRATGSTLDGRGTPTGSAAEGRRGAIDCGALWKQLAARLGGRGGGRADRADGRIPGPPGTLATDWPAIIAELLA